MSREEAPAHAVRLRAIFRDAVLAAGRHHYSQAQCDAWAASADDLERWSGRLATSTTWIAVATDEPDRAIAELLLHPADHVDLLYVDPAWHRRGVAAALLLAIEADVRSEGIAALTTEASLMAQPAFAASGYDVVDWEDVERQGQVFRRARMRKALA